MKKILNTKTLAFALLSLLICAFVCVSALASDYQMFTYDGNGLTLENDHAIYSFDKKGIVTNFTFKEDGVNYLGSRSYIAALYDDLGEYLPTAIIVNSQNGNSLFITVEFDTVGAELDFKISVHDDFFLFELLDKIPDGYNHLTMGTVKLASSYLSSEDGSKSNFAAFAYALHYNTKMDTYPSYFERYTTVGCSTYSFTDTEGLGAKFATVTCPRNEYYDVLRFIVDFIADPNVVPVSNMGGAYAATEEVKEAAVQDYAIVSGVLDDATIRHYLDYNVTQFDFHQGGNSFRQGSMDFAPSIGDTAAGFKEKMTDHIKKIAMEEYGLYARTGLHTYAYYIDVENKELLSKPETVRQLEYFTDEIYTLANPLSAFASTIPVFEDTSNFDMEVSFFKCNSRYLRIDDELMLVTGFEDNAFHVTRGRCGTTATTHRRGSDVYHLTGLFGMLCPQLDSELFLDIARYTAKAYVEGGFEMIYVDAIDGFNRHTNQIWYYSGLFVGEICKEIEAYRNKEEYKDVIIPDPIFEFSSMSTAYWSVRTRTGAMDTVCRGIKDFVAYHTQNNVQSTANTTYTTNIGWYALWNGEGDAPVIMHTQYWDSIDLLGKNIIAHNMGYSYNGFSQASIEAYPNHKDNGDLLLKYLRLRDEGYFTDAVIEKIKGYRDEWKLIENSKGEYGFEHRSYTELKFNALTDIGLVNNPFSSQVPVLIRIRTLNTDAETDYATIADFNENAPISDLIGSKGKTTYTLNFEETPVSNNTYKAIRVRVYGNNSDAKLSLALYGKDDSTYSYVIPLNFEGWRDVILSEVDNGINDQEFYNSGSYAFNRTTDRSISYIKLKGSGDFSGVKIDTIKMAKSVYSEVVNPGVTYNGNTITFNTTLTDNGYIEFDGKKAIQYTNIGVPTEITYTASGNLVAPEGDFNVAVTGKGTHNVDRAWVSMGFAGEQVFNDLSNEAVSEIVVKTNPYKNSYIVGETLDTAGLTIFERMNTGRKRDVESGWKVDSITFTESGILKIPVIYNGFTTEFTVVVHDIAPTNLEIVSLPQKTNFYIGEQINTDGLVLRETYNNGTVKSVTSGYQLSIDKFTKEGYTKVTVKYGGLEASYEVYVATPSLISMEVTKLPDKTVYTAGEMFSTVGMVVTGTYSANIKNEVVDYTFTPNGGLTVGVKEIIIVKNGIETVCPITVNAPSATTGYELVLEDYIALPGATAELSLTANAGTVTAVEALEFTAVFDDALTYNGIKVNLPAGWEIWETVTGNTVNIALVNEGSTASPISLADFELFLVFKTPDNSVSGQTFAVEIIDTLATDTAYALVEGVGDTAQIRSNTQLVLVSSSDYVIDRAKGIVIISHAETSIAEFTSNFANAVDVNTTLAIVPTGAVVSLELDGVVVDKLTIILPGDVNGNGKIDATDYTMAKRGFLGTKLTEARNYAADTNCNGYIDTSDYMLIKKHVTGQINMYE